MSKCWALGPCGPVGMHQSSPTRTRRPKADEHGVPSAAALSRLCKIDIKGDKKEQWMRLPTPESSVTQHHLSAGGKSFDYTATAGTLIVRDDEDKPIASHRLRRLYPQGCQGQRQRPSHHLRLQRRPRVLLAVAAHGRAGSRSASWSPIRTRPRPVPTARCDNEFGMLDKSDLVMIDPVGTGLSHAVCDHKDDEFWAVDPDVDSISRFIAQYVSDNERWTSRQVPAGGELRHHARRRHRQLPARAALLRLQRADPGFGGDRYRGHLRRVAGQ